MEVILFRRILGRYYSPLFSGIHFNVKEFIGRLFPQHEGTLFLAVAIARVSGLNIPVPCGNAGGPYLFAITPK